MSHDQHGHAVVCKALHNTQHLAYHFRVERRCRFVEQQHLGIHRHCARNSDALLLSAGYLTRPGIYILRHANALKIVQGMLLCALPVPLQHLHLTDNAVFKHSHIVEKVERLEHHADMRTVLRRVHTASRNISAVVYHFAEAGCFEQVDAPEKRRLAGARRAYDAYNVPLFNGEVYILEYLVCAEGL